MIGRQQNGKGEQGLPINGWRAVQPRLLRLLPYVESQADIKDSLNGHQTDDCQVEILQNGRKDSLHRYSSSTRRRYLFDLDRQHVVQQARPVADFPYY